MLAEEVLDTNVIVGWLDPRDSQRLAATEGFLCIDGPAPDSTGGQNPSA